MHRENLIEEIDPLQEKVVDAIMQVKKGLGESKITADTIHIIIKQVMELVEKFSIPGKDKRVYVVRIVKELVDDLVVDETERNLINNMIEKRLLENTIDLIILASKGDFDINNKNTQEKLVKYIRTVVPLIMQFIFYIYNSFKDIVPQKDTPTKTPETETPETETPETETPKEKEHKA